MKFTKIIFFSILNTTSVSLFERYDGFRGLGFAGSVTYDLAVFMSIGLMCMAYLSKVQVYNKLYWSISFIIIASAMIITGRTGLDRISNGDVAYVCWFP